jgi:magnesium transporter
VSEDDGQQKQSGSDAKAADHGEQPPGKHKAICLHNPTLEEMHAHYTRGEFFWADLDNPDDEVLRKAGDLLGLHSLTVSDIQEFRERAKFEEFPGYVFLVVYGVDADAKGEDDQLLREVHLAISGNWVVTIHRRKIPALEELRNRYSDASLRSEQQLVYWIIDAVVGTYFPVLERIDEEIDQIEDEVIDNPNEESMRRIFGLKRDLVTMRRVVTPMRDIFARSTDRIADLPGLEPDDRPYFRDLYDSVIRVSDLIDSYRDLLSGATDLYLSTVANRQGEVNKQLTIIATIFLPLTFITGFFGQNFAFLTNHITESTWSFVVFGVGFLVVSAVGFMIYFKRRHWIG